MLQPDSNLDTAENSEPVNSTETMTVSTKMETEIKSTDKEEILKRHRLEKRELQNKIQSLKKSVPKGDKNKKKIMTEMIAKLEKDCEEKHAQELSGFDAANTDENMETGDVVEPVKNIEEPAPRVSRAQKRRNKKDLEARERERRMLEHYEKNKDGPRYSEMSTIVKVLKDLNLRIHNIPADGNCLYLAVNHQLQLYGLPSFTVNELRKKTANFLRANKEDFLPFMYNEDEEAEVNVSDDGFESYCKEVEKTKLWGGQLELRALSNVLSCPIKVIQASGPPTIQGENLRGPELTLTYHRYLYQLGEHYNSTLPLERG